MCVCVFVSVCAACYVFISFLWSICLAVLFDCAFGGQYLSVCLSVGSYACLCLFNVFITVSVTVSVDVI